MAAALAAPLSLKGLRNYLLGRWRPSLLPPLLFLLALLRLLRARRRALPLQMSPLEVMRCYWSRTILQMHHEWSRKAGMACWTVKLPHDPRIFVTVNPAIVEHVLISKFTKYDKGPQWRTAFHDLLGQGIFNVDGAMWKMQRKVASHEFSVRSLRDFMFKVFKAHAAEVVEIVQRACEEGAVVNAQDLFARYTLDSIGQIGFGVEIGCLEDSEVGSARAEEFSRAFDTATRLSADRFVDPFWKLKRLLNVGTERELRAAIAGVCAFSDRVISERRAASSVDLAHRHDLLSRYMRHAGPGKARPGSGMPEFSFTDENLRDIVINFVLAGRDTTANLLTWSLFELAQHPQAAEALRSEAARARADRQQKTRGRVDSDGCDSLDFEALSRMPYMQATLTEVLRLHPSVPVDFKTANEDDVLPDGTQVHRGERIMFVTWSMGRQPELWPEPERFNPTRFLTDAPPSDSSSDCSASPVTAAGDAGVRFKFPSPARFPVFHAGPRTCLGKDSAYLGAGLVIAELLERFDVELVSRPEGIEHENGLTLWIQGGLHVRFLSRQAAP